ncbi:nucleotidyltransferase family protein [Paenibacillus sinopodophylli]|uniref:nucleotidyltransferase family protein n=1 Tax=Paenibacillus sinopodophylli TaxID=1837342 RepID=UPI00110D0625|nr:nucleotidyltransferase family protein [Paenibacillus sinopodophylli]
MKRIDMNSEIEKELQKRLLVPSEQRLLSLLFKEHVNIEEIEDQLQGLNMDTGNHNYLLMLAHFGYNVDWIGFPEHVIPQLKGIYRYYQVENALMLQKLFMSIQKLNENNIYPLLLKGAAMRLHFASGVSRMMADIDFALEGKQYEKAVSIFQDMGAEYIVEAKHSITYKLGKTEFDIHHVIFKNNLEKGSDIWERVEQIEVNSCQFRVLSPVDMFVHILDSQSRCIFVDEMPERRMKWLFDAKMVLKMMPGTDWTAVAKRANELHCSYRVHLMMKLFAACFPEDISLEDVSNLFAVDSGYAKWLKDAMDFYETIVPYMKERRADENSSITLRVIRLRIKYKPIRKEYRYYSHELKKLESGMCFARYVADLYHLNRPVKLYRKYLSRLKLR